MCSERPGHQHLADAGILRGRTCHLVQHGEAAVDLVTGSPVLFDSTGEVLPEAGVEEVVVFPT